jgi:hypothetical protein
MIKKLILSKQSYFQLSLVLLGSVFGLLLMMLSMQIYFDIKGLISNKKEAIGSHFIVLSQPVNLMNTLSGNANYFDAEELDELKQLPGVESVAPFASSQFKAKAGFDFNGQSMYTDMFFESVPNEFLEIDQKEWQWQESQDLPIILPTDYLNLYNFGFAPGQNLPQISRNTAKLAGLKVNISNNNDNLNLNARIAGFTDRINSILVPESFIQYGNSKFGVGTQKGSSRVVLKSKDPSNVNLLKHIESKGYETNLELLKGGKMNALLNLVMTIVMLICLVVIVLSVLSFVQYSQLLINHSKYEIKTLLELGYKVNFIFKYYFMFYFLLMVFVLVISSILMFFIYNKAHAFFVENGYEINNGLSVVMMAVTGMVMFFFVGLNAFGSIQSIKRMA